MTDSIIITAVGTLAGLHSASWGAYKDTPYEGYSAKKFARSIVVAIFSALVAGFLLEKTGIMEVNLGVMYGLVVIMERASTEMIKAYLREEPQDKYKIPSTVHLLGRRIKNRTNRLITGVIFTSAFIALTAAVFQIKEGIIAGEAGGIIFGLAGGLLVAIGGCLKDAPLEGFNGRKFMRSPLTAMTAGFFLSNYTGNYGIIMLSSMGVERMATELYKTFLKQGVPGKFKAEKPLHTEWLVKRRIFLAPYALTWILFILLFQHTLWV